MQEVVTAANEQCRCPYIYFRRRLAEWRLQGPAWQTSRTTVHVPSFRLENALDILLFTAFTAGTKAPAVSVTALQCLWSLQGSPPRWNIEMSIQWNRISKVSVASANS